MLFNFKQKLPERQLKALAEALRRSWIKSGVVDLLDNWIT